ncbi:anti-sigma-28 factor, FlgM family [Nitrosomonas cryotolerans]|uniref:Negative regulator of flagellin synthesis n=1 Tax=Nitrosomonas cryotolerans ATCC 49181 TaxID=1131553 RepID=A0A1N6IMG4_9PROT|nr:flagellar biosynthesis anti-sigma factor FlgM [Nitrosomonas cryotolerans]SFP36501.1 anti-sigma-28 factor, FlgM family [Nitrosomonas cryotolerans]SIO33238.1 anti-sigma-28 factor, FlgM family [Nitrosomonas cryotolerans ATCC 49181]
MKVDNSVPSLTNVSASIEKKRTDTTPNTNQEYLDTTAHLNPRITQQKTIGSNLATSPVIDTARVQEIKQAISEGNFKINPEVIADRLLETAKELIQSKKGGS